MSNESKIDNNLEILKSNVISGAIQGLKKAGNIVVESSKEKSPVKTGALRDSIKILENDLTYIKIGSKIYYAFLQHETNPNGKAFFLRNALIDNEEEITKTVADSIVDKMR